jgi:predicted small integral membrane protein
MDTTFPNNALLYRSIGQPPLWHLAYLTIIAAEGVTCLLLVIGAAALLRTLRATGAEFDDAKRYTIIGGTLAFLVWFVGFAIVGGEWFAMWQSKLWNGQEPAFRFYMTALAVLIFVNQPDATASPEKK